MRMTGADEGLIWLIDEWAFLSAKQKKKTMWIVRRDQIKWWVIRIILISTIVTLVQFISLLGMR